MIYFSGNSVTLKKRSVKQRAEFFALFLRFRRNRRLMQRFGDFHAHNTGHFRHFHHTRWDFDGDFLYHHRFVNRRRNGSNGYGIFRGKRRFVKRGFGRLRRKLGLRFLRRLFRLSRGSCSDINGEGCGLAFVYACFDGACRCNSVYSVYRG